MRQWSHKIFLVSEFSFTYLLAPDYLHVISSHGEWDEMRVLHWNGWGRKWVINHFQVILLEGTIDMTLHNQFCDKVLRCIPFEIQACHMAYLVAWFHFVHKHDNEIFLGKISVEDMSFLGCS
jgi:hypothetical protein